MDNQSRQRQQPYQLQKSNLDLSTDLLAQELSSTNFDLAIISRLLDLICENLEEVHATQNINICTIHRLCQSIVTCFFCLLEYNCDIEEFPKVLSFVRVSLTCMSLLRGVGVSSHILCRSLLERSFANGSLFKKDFEPEKLGLDSKPSAFSFDESTKLSEENLRVNISHKFKRLPNARKLVEHKTYDYSIASSSKQIQFDDDIDKESINCYLLIQAFKSSINHIEHFATLFVEFLCPIMLDKHVWQTEESLRVINERDLTIMRKFEQLPPLWHLFELLGQKQCLGKCMNLVKPLLAAQLALWASNTAKTTTDRLISTSRLIPPLAQSGLVPSTFGLAVDVLPKLDPPQVFAVLKDIWDYVKDTHDLKQNKKSPRKTRHYLHRLRIFMCEKDPGELFVKLFHNLPEGNIQDDETKSDKPAMAAL